MIVRLPKIVIDINAYAVVVGSTPDAVKRVTFTDGRSINKILTEALVGLGFELLTDGESGWFVIGAGYLYKVRVATQADNNAKRKIDLAPSATKGKGRKWDAFLESRRKAARDGFIIMASTVQPDLFVATGWIFGEEDIDASKFFKGKTKKADWGEVEEHLIKHETKEEPVTV